jgi:hypothetical protein
MILAGMIMLTIGYLYRYEPSTTMVPVIVVDKIVNPSNPGLLLTQLDGGNGKNAYPKKVFKKDIRSTEYIVVADSPDGVEYNIRTDKISFTAIKIMDTLWTLR